MIHELLLLFVQRPRMYNCNLIETFVSEMDVYIFIHDMFRIGALTKYVKVMFFIIINKIR